MKNGEKCEFRMQGCRMKVMERQRKIGDSAP